MSLYRRKGSDIWKARIVINGVVHQFTTGTANKNTARSIEAAKRTDILKGNVGLSAPTLEDFAERFINSLPGRVSKQTYRFYVCHWKPLVAFEPLAKCRIDRIGPAVIEDFVTWRRAGGRAKRKPVESARVLLAGTEITSPRAQKTVEEKPRTVSTITVNHALRTLRRALHKAHEWGLIPKVPKITLLPHEHQRDYVLSEDTVKKFETDEKGVIGKLVPFLVDTGLRRGEVVALEWTDVNFAERYIEVRKGKTKFARRKVPLTKRAEAILEKLPRKDERVWTVNGKRITIDWISHAFLRARKRLKLPDGAVLHSTRHTFCTRLGERGGDAFAIQRLAGHSSITISQRYVHPSAGRLDAAIALLN